MQRLLEAFAAQFDLDRRVRGTRLGDLVVRSIGEIEDRALPDWGSPGPAEHWDVESDRALHFYYSPHLFPGMSVNLRLAHKLQFHMLPREVPAGAPLSIAAVLESYCHLSGDLFGWEMLDDGRFLIWIVDLSGHGVRSGLSSAVLRLLIGNLRERERERERVGSLVAELNDTFVGCLRDDKSNLFATGFFLTLSDDGTACYSSAGHPPMLLRRQEGRIERLPATGLPLGMFGEREFPAHELRIEPGDALLLYTDGLVETVNRDGESFGLERLVELLEPELPTPRAFAHTLYEAIAGFQDMDQLEDDVTFVAALRRSSD